MPSSATHSTTSIYTLSLHDALPIFEQLKFHVTHAESCGHTLRWLQLPGKFIRETGQLTKVCIAGSIDHALRNDLSEAGFVPAHTFKDRKSTRLNSSHSQTSYAVFCYPLDHLDLHSFPTRRSSDLRTAQVPRYSCGKLWSYFALAPTPRQVHTGNRPVDKSLHRRKHRSRVAQ